MEARNEHGHEPPLFRLASTLGMVFAALDFTFSDTLAALLLTGLGHRERSQLQGLMKGRCCLGFSRVHTGVGFLYVFGTRGVLGMST